MSAVANGLIRRPRPCACGGLMERGVRIGPGIRQRTNVLICWRCAYEEPSAYRRSTNERTTSGARA